MLPAEAEQGDISLFVSALILRHASSCSLLIAMFLTFVLFVGVSLFKKAAGHSAEVLPGVPKSKKAVTCLMEKTRVLDELSSGMSSMSMNQQYVLNTVTIYRDTHIKWGYVLIG